VPPLLHAEGLVTGYGRIEIIHGVDLVIPEGRVVALIGPNGAGKTTTLRAVAGALPIWAGTVRLAGRRVDGRSAFDVARRGITLIPEGRGIFPGLTVKENLEIASRAGRGLSAGERSTELDRVLEIFPRLRERHRQEAGTLSGGEQQMLSLTRAFLAKPRVLMMDEISMGLAPILVEQLFAGVERLRRDGQTIILVEQFLTHVLRLADICYVMSKGRIDFVGEPRELRDSDILAGSYLGAR
jgi:branched-chain amino acid transport system ATP-binding protein